MDRDHCRIKLRYLLHSLLFCTVSPGCKPQTVSPGNTGQPADLDAELCLYHGGICCYAQGYQTNIGQIQQVYSRLLVKLFYSGIFQHFSGFSFKADFLLFTGSFMVFTNLFTIKCALFFNLRRNETSTGMSYSVLMSMCECPGFFTIICHLLCRNHKGLFTVATLKPAVAL